MKIRLFLIISVLVVCTAPVQAPRVDALTLVNWRIGQYNRHIGTTVIKRTEAFNQAFQEYLRKRQILRIEDGRVIDMERVKALRAARVEMDRLVKAAKESSKKLEQARREMDGLR